MKCFFIDPQSYNNLADYDKYLLQNIKLEKYFFCSTKFPYKEIENVTIIPIYKYNDKTGILKIFSYINSQLKILRRIKIEKPDIIHFQWFKIPKMDIILLKRIKKISKQTKIIHTAHNVLPHDSGEKFKNSYKIIYKMVDQIIVHTDITKKEISKLFNIDSKKISVIPHGFLPQKIIKKRNSLFSGITFSFIGFISDYKGLDLLLSAWLNNSNLLNNFNYRLVIAGAGKIDMMDDIPMDSNIIVENYFHTEEELAQIIANTDVAILPYRRISQSGVLLTYLAERIPVLVSDVGGLTQPFQIGKVGWILDDLTVDSLSELLTSIVKNPSEIAEIKNNKSLWNSVGIYYDWKNIGEITKQLYKSKCEV